MNVLFEGNTRTGKDEWLTPPSIIRSLGIFDLDPCSPINRPWETAKVHYTVNDDGLSKQWFGRVWCNPPYDQTINWLRKCSRYKNAIALTFARTETKMFQQYVFPYADALMFINGRLSFYHVTGEKGGTAGAPSVLIAYGKENADQLKNSDIKGYYVALR
jgi:hypothetical protein